MVQPPKLRGLIQHPLTNGRLQPTIGPGFILNTKRPHLELAGELDIHIAVAYRGIEILG